MKVHNDLDGIGYLSSGAADDIDQRTLYDQADLFLAQHNAIDLSTLMTQARALREEGHGRVISYSRKVFVPLTRLCRDTCGYCTFATTPSKVASPYLSPDETLEIAESGKRAGCHEVLFTLGDKPELRYPAARKALEKLGYSTTVEYLAAMCDLVLRKTGLLPHVNAGVMGDGELLLLRKVSISQGIMLESISEALCERGGPHFGSPDKLPSVRLEMIAAAGRHKIPFTTGILIGIGESRRDRVASLFALYKLHRQYNHIQEIIIQNFRAKPKTRMASSEEPGLDDLLWTAAVARIIFGPRMNIQVPPNLSYNNFASLLKSGINDWGGVSPVTPDHINPEAPWPALDRLAEATEAANLDLVARLPAYPAYLHMSAEWQDENSLLRSQALRFSDATGFARDCDWAPGLAQEAPTPRKTTRSSPSTEKLIAKRCPDRA